MFTCNSSFSSKSRRSQCRYLISFLVRIIAVSIGWLLDDVIYFRYRRTAINSPIFIVCQPRSGSTFLHRTLLEDDRFVATRYIEWHYPAITLQRAMKLMRPFRRLLSVAACSRASGTPQVIELMHSAKKDDYEEDDLLFDELYYCNYFTAVRHPFPELLSEYADFSRLPARVRRRMLLTYRKVIQKVLYLHGPDRVYVGKLTESHDMLTSLRELFPNARFISQARASSDYMNSLNTYNREAALTRIQVDLNLVSGWDAAHTAHRERMARSHLDFMRQLSADAGLVLAYSVFIEEIPRTILGIYNWLGVPYDMLRQKSLVRLQENQKLRRNSYKVSSDQFPSLRFFDEFVVSCTVIHKRMLGDHQSGDCG
jgi:omega-hydroxy-beta-dihydromenaquinone-9 sulfotransferase